MACLEKVAKPGEDCARAIAGAHALENQLVEVLAQTFSTLRTDSSPSSTEWRFIPRMTTVVRAVFIMAIIAAIAMAWRFSDTVGIEQLGKPKLPSVSVSFGAVQDSVTSAVESVGNAGKSVVSTCGA